MSSNDLMGEQKTQPAEEETSELTADQLSQIAGGEGGLDDDDFVCPQCGSSNTHLEPEGMVNTVWCLSCGCSWPLGMPRD